MKGERQSILAVRGRFLDITGVVKSPLKLNEQKNIRHLEDGLMLVKDGHIKWLGHWQKGEKKLPHNCKVLDHREKLIVPGFIDTHIHFPQTEIMGSYGEQLLAWLNNYAFPAEIKYGDKNYADEMADFFVNQLLQNGTTTALVFCTVHPESVDALFSAANRKNMRIIAGKVLMDRNAPKELLDTAETGYSESKKLIEKWHNKDRLLYAITVRFAPTSTPRQLEMAGKLKREYPNTYLHTHLSENREEIEWVKELFPEQENYLDVYHHYGLTGSRSVFAHCLHLEYREWQCLQDTDSAIAFCPTSNLFLGSGLFNLYRARENKVKVGIATDVGGGTSFNMLQTLNEAYKVMQLQKQEFSAYDAFYLATLGAAKALSLDHLIGNFDVGKEADFVVLDPEATALQAKRTKESRDIEDLLFSLIMLGDDRTIAHTYVDGQLVHKREQL